MGLRERLLYGKDKAFGEWFSAQCTYVQNNAEVARKRSINQSVAASIGVNEDLMGPSVQALFVTYLVMCITYDRGATYLEKRLNAISTIIHNELGPSAANIYAYIMQEIPAQKTAPESILSHMLVDGLNLPLSAEDQAREQVFAFFDNVLEELYVPSLSESFRHNPKAVHNLLETLGRV